MSEAFPFYKNWMEFFFFVLVAIGLLVAFFAPSAAISYLLVFLSGFFAGRLFYEKKHREVMPYLIIIMGFLIGYLIGMKYGDRIAVIVVFLAGAMASYKLYDKKILKDTRF